ncbi:MAG TPA: hypothetical protein VF666_16400 [Pyrinomonadaceae bacterium]|jgi:hypothetical protein
MLTTLAIVVISAFGMSNAQAQTPAATPLPLVVMPAQKAQMSVGSEHERFCGGFIEYNPAPIRFEVVGSEQEQEQTKFAEGDYLYINAGSQQGVTVGQEFAVVRPRGRFTSKFTRKKGTLGVFTQEIGRLQVTEVKTNVSVAYVVRSCEIVLLGDVLRAVPQPPSVTTSTEFPLRRFTDPTGKQQGRIVLAREGREMLSENQVVYVDLGREDNVKPGDTLTVYRPVGRGRVAYPLLSDMEVIPNKKNGYESEEFRGGKFSNQAQRVKNPNDTEIFNRQPTVTTPEVKRRRPSLPRKIVGEAIVLNVEARTATVLITQAAQEIHTGDYVELK